MTRTLRILGLSLAASTLFAGAASAAETYTVDNSHTAVLFFAKHFQFGQVIGRFKAVSGEYSLDEADITKSKLSLELKIDSLDTNEGKRDEHLKGPDFFNAKQFPTATFVSTAVKKAGDALEVTGDLTIHGVKKATTLKVKPIAKGNDPFGMTRTGFEGELNINRNDFGVSGLPPIPADIKLMFSLEGVLKK
jgi:polyisoprenoid-binding protein YceI